MLGGLFFDDAYTRDYATTSSMATRSRSPTLSKLSHQKSKCCNRAHAADLTVWLPRQCNVPRARLHCVGSDRTGGGGSSD